MELDLSNPIYLSGLSPIGNQHLQLIRLSDLKKKKKNIWQEKVTQSIEEARIYHEAKVL